MRNMAAVILFPPLIGFLAACNKSSSSDGPSAPAPTPVPAQPTPLVEPAATPDPTTPVPTPENPNVPVPGTPDPAVAPTGDTPPEGTPPEGTPPVVVPTPEPVPPPTELRIKEAQFWVYQKVDGDLTFNTPWDETEGDTIVRDETAAPAYAVKCLKEAKDIYADLSASQSFQDRIKPILANGATADLTFLIVSSESADDRAALRRLDRDAYFWHWTDPAKKPVLTLNQYEKGSWVWEVIATPKSCIQPVVREIGRYLDWTSRRQAEKGANK